MDLKQLSYFVRVAELGSFTRAAAALGVAQPALSRQIRMLEEVGLVQSRPDEHDGRLRVLTATAQARRTLAVLRKENAERMQAVLAELTPDEVKAASKVFRLLAEV